MKKLFLTLVICICVVSIVTIVTRTDLFDKKTDYNDIRNNYADYDVCKMLEDVKNISNIYLEMEYSDGTIYKIYIKDNMKKSVSDDTIAINDISENKTTSYKTTDNKGIIFNSKIPLSNDYFNSDYIIYDKNKYEYIITYEIVNKNNCIKVTAINKISNETSFIVWFNLDNNLIVKTQEGKNYNDFCLYKNIKLNYVTDEDFEIPNDVKLTTLNY